MGSIVPGGADSEMVVVRRAGAAGVRWQDRSMPDRSSSRRVRQRFHGAIAGIGSTSGIRVVVGRWDRSPWGAFADLMVETPAGHRVLIAPSEQVAEFVSATYTFDEIRQEPVTVTDTPDGWSVASASAQLELAIGDRTPLGRLLRLVPGVLGSSPAWCAVTDPFARVVLRGVRTRGSAKGGRREFYGATEVRSVSAARGSFDGVDLGGLADVRPPCTFGFSSVPPAPSVTRLVTTVDLRP
jgi:hypothetical protein